MKNRISFAAIAAIIVLSCSSCYVKVGGRHRDRVNAEPMRNEMERGSVRSGAVQQSSQIPISKEEGSETD